jgi:hypothetical protein
MNSRNWLGVLAENQCWCFGCPTRPRGRINRESKTSQARGTRLPDLWYIPFFQAEYSASLHPTLVWQTPDEGPAVTIDEELNQLEETVRRLKIEYDVFFGGGSKKPPNDTEWRVRLLVKKYSDGHNMSFPQRFRYNSIVQRYALFSDLWRQKMKIKEEGYRRPQDAVLGIAGMRTEEEHQAAEALSISAAEPAKPFTIQCSDVDRDHEKVLLLFNAMMEARKQQGVAAGANAVFDSFKAFVQKKTDQIRKDYGCNSVEYSVEIENGQVRLKAKAKV